LRKVSAKNSLFKVFRHYCVITYFTRWVILAAHFLAAPCTLRRNC